MAADALGALAGRLAGDLLGVARPVLRRVPLANRLVTDTRRPNFASYRERPDARAAVVFVHGFLWQLDPAFARFPQALSTVPELEDWDLHGVGYTTAGRPDLAWWPVADPPIELLATYLRTRAGLPPLSRYDSLALVGHSMGGLVIQRALLDDDALTGRVSHVVLLGTPSAGLRLARWAGFLKRQIHDMGEGSEFISDLRSRWDDRFGTKPPFSFWTVAGDCDTFVPATSSLAPFPPSARLVVPGNHLDIGLVSGPESMSVKVLTRILLGDAAPAGPWNSARVAVEERRFHKAVTELLPHVTELDEQHLVELAVALDAVGDRAAAIDVLRRSPRLGSDARGVLAGRLKRNWLAAGTEEDARSAVELYREGYADAADAGRHEQAYYHGINLAFLTLTYSGDPAGARTVAHEVLDHCAQAPAGIWRAATEGEAWLYLDDGDRAVAAYAAALADSPSAREAASMYEQAVRVCDALRRPEMRRRLTAMFRPQAERDAVRASGQVPPRGER